MNLYEKIKYNDQGLIPAIVQDISDGKVLMMAWMNEASIRMSLETGFTHFWSRSRKTFWKKGESSGHTQRIKSISLDCDGDTLLIQAEQVGAACHEGFRSCFFRSTNGTSSTLQILDERFADPEDIYNRRT